MNRARLSQGAFKYLMTITVLLTGTFGALVFGERPEAPAVKMAKRRVAQVEANLKPTVLKIPCWDELADLKVPRTTKWVRVTGKVCKGQIGLDEVRITNETNHVVATIFPLEDGLTTDLLPLAEGVNDLTFVIARPGGQITGHLALTR